MTMAGTAQAIGVEGPWAPEDKGSYVQGWTNVYDAACPSSGVCHTYIKIERGSWRGWQFVNGGWISGKQGWQSMDGNKSRGCYDYRTVVEVYLYNNSSVEIGVPGAFSVKPWVTEKIINQKSSAARYCG